MRTLGVSSFLDKRVKFSGGAAAVRCDILALLVEYKARKAPPASDSNKAKKRKR
jgi:hypothetical protein